MTVTAPGAPDVMDQLRRVSDMLDRGRPAAARALLNGVKHGAPCSPELLEQEARLLFAEDHADMARDVLDDAVARFPGSPRLWLTRAGGRLKADDAAGAARDAAEALTLAPTLSHAKAMLGLALLELGNHADARACMADALATDPANADWRQVMARACELGGDSADALRCLEDGLKHRPEHHGLRAQAMRLHMRHGRFAAAETLGETARRAGVADALVLRLIGDSRMKHGLFDAAVEAYQDARKLAPEDPYLRHLLAAAGGLPAGDRAPPGYVSALFDGDAAHFDTRLRELGYRIPDVFRDELRGRAPASGVVLDLGCGTGLQAATSADLPLSAWIGVDLSGRMLAEAARRHLYEELHQQDIFAFLAGTPRRFNVVLAGDVLPYFGDLAPVAIAVAGRLQDGGCFLLSTEELRDEAPDATGWRLGRRGRFAHTRDHITAAAAAAGLVVVVLRPEIIRLEAGEPVPGLFAVLERTRA